MSNVAPLRAGSALAPIVPTSFEEVQRLAVMAVKSGLFKDAKRRRTQSEEDAADGSNADTEATVAKATMAIMQGLEVGLAPMQAIQTIAIINGRCSIWGDAVPALLWSRGFKMREWVDGEGDNAVAHCEVTRPDGTLIERTFSVADAKRARLWDERATLTRKGQNGSWYEADNDSPWYRFPMRMLAMRARGFAWRDGAADVGRGLYTAEEAQDAEMKDITPVQRASAALPDIPHFPDAVDDLPPDDDPPIVDVAGYLANYKEELAALDGAERQEFIDGNADVVARLPAEARKEIADLLKARVS